MNTLQLEIESPVGGGTRRPLEFTVRKMINIGYAGRNQAAVQAHIDELRAIGVPAPPRIPYCIPVAARNITTDCDLEVLPGNTSGEVEIVFFLQGDQTWIGVGSDHTDRDLEAASIDKAKQICPNFVSRRVWSLADLADRWDSLQLTAHLTDTAGVRRLYQQGTLAQLLPAPALIDCVLTQCAGASRNGLVIYSGTIPLATPPSHATADSSHDSVTPQSAPAQFDCTLTDPATRRQLTCQYRIHLL